MGISPSDHRRCETHTEEVIIREGAKSRECDCTVYLEKTGRVSVHILTITWSVTVDIFPRVTLNQSLHFNVPHIVCGEEREVNREAEQAEIAASCGWGVV